MGDGWVSALDAVHMAAALAGYIEQPWLVLAGPFLTLLTQMGSGTTPLPM